MERKDVVNFINELENRFPVNEWRYGEMDIWPIVKADFFFKWFKKGKEDKENILEDDLSIFRKILRLLSSLFFLAKFLLQPSRRVNIIFFGAAHYRVSEHGVSINRYFEPIVENMPEGEFIEVEYGNKDKQKEYKRNSRIFFSNQFFFAFALIRKLRKNEKFNLKEWDTIIKEVESKLNINLSHYKGDLLMKLRNFLSYSDFFLLLFKKYNPKKIIGLCYYSPEMFAAHYAANKLSLLNFDLQHGGQGSLHPMYTFKYLPPGGYNTLPKIFWCWDSVSANNILKWIHDNSFHQVIVKGNPWIEYQLKKHHEKICVSNKKIILFTLQEEKIDQFVLDAIEKTLNDFQWWIRLHPRMMNAKIAIEKQLATNNIGEQVELKMANAYPLPLLLMECQVHISKYSGSIIEAALLNKKSIIIDEVGVENYREYINVKMAIPFLSKDPNGLLNLIKDLSKEIN